MNRVNHQGNLLFVITRDPLYLCTEDHVPDSTGAYSSDPLDRTARRVTCQLLQGPDDKVQRLGISRGDGVDLRAIVQEDSGPVPINKGCTQVEGPEPMSSRVVIPLGGFSRGFYFAGFGGWSVTLALGPFWSFLGTPAPLFLPPPNTFNRSPSCPIRSLISCRACLRGLVHCRH